MEMYPLVEVPDLLREVDEWIGFADQFTDVRTGCTAEHCCHAGRCACRWHESRPETHGGASKGISTHQIGWMRSFHVRSETYRTAQACVTDAHTAPSAFANLERRNDSLIRWTVLPRHVPARRLPPRWVPFQGFGEDRGTEKIKVRQPYEEGDFREE